MIEGFTIRGFRGIDELSMEGLSLINVFVGRNNSSKSSVLEALALLIASLNGAGPLRRTLEGVLAWRGWYGPSSIDDLFHSGGDAFTVDARLSDGSKASLTLRNGGEGFENQLVAYLEILENSTPRKFRLAVDRDDLTPPEVPSSSISSESFLPRYGFEFMTPMTFRTYGYVELLYSRAYEMKVVERAVEILRNVYPEVEGLSPLLDGDRWVLHVKTSDGVHPYYLMGEGFKSTLIIALLMPLLGDGYLFIDTVEAFQHPSSLRVMARTLVEGARSNNVQVFMTTHMPGLVEMLSRCKSTKGLEGRVIHMVKRDRITYSVYPLEGGGEFIEEIMQDLGG